MTIELKNTDGQSTGKSITLDKFFLEKAVALGAAALQILNRPDWSELPESARQGTITLFDDMKSVINGLKNKIEAKGADDPLLTKPLDLDIAKIQDAFAAQARHFRDMRVLLQTLHPQNPSREMCALCDIKNNEKITIENPKDAACAVFALGFMSKRGEMAKDLSETVANADSNQTAARTLSTYWNKLIRPMGPNIRYRGHQETRTDLFNALEQYRDRYHARDSNVAIEVYNRDTSGRGH